MYYKATIYLQAERPGKTHGEKILFYRRKLQIVENACKNIKNINKSGVDGPEHLVSMQIRCSNQNEFFFCFFLFFLYFILIFVFCFVPGSLARA